MSHTILQYSTVLPFTSTTFSNLSDTFRPFVTFLDFTLFNTPPDCVAFSIAFLQTLSHNWCTIVSAFWLLFWANQHCTLPVSFYYYSCTYISCYQHLSNRTVDLVVIINNTITIAMQAYLTICCNWNGNN